MSRSGSGRDAVGCMISGGKGLLVKEWKFVRIMRSNNEYLRITYMYVWTVTGLPV